MTTRANTSEGGLLRAVGALGLAAGIVNITIGGGIYRLPASVAETMGAAAPLAYLICAGVMGMIALCIAEAGSRVSLTGGPYAYVEVAFGPFAGFLAGVMNWLIGATAIGAIGVVFIDNLGAMVPAFGSPVGRVVGLIGGFSLLAAVNVTGVKHGARLSTGFTLVKVLPLLVLIAFGLFAIEPANLRVESMPEAATITRTSIVLLFAFTGVESALILGGELKDPSRTVPRGILIGMVSVTVVYLAVHLVAQGVLGPALAGAATPLADAAGIAMGPWGRTLLLVAVIVSTFGYLSGMALASPRALYAFGRDGYLPRAVGAVHPTFKTPWVAVILQLAICSTLSLTSRFTALAVISNVAALLVYFACAGAAVQLRRQGVRIAGSTPFRLPGGPVIPIIAGVAIIALLTSITWSEWLVLLEVAGAATVIFFATRRHRAAMPRPASD